MSVRIHAEPERRELESDTESRENLSRRMNNIICICSHACKLKLYENELCSDVNIYLFAVSKHDGVSGCEHFSVLRADIMM